jgi:hypothetical protein
MERYQCYPYMLQMLQKLAPAISLTNGFVVASYLQYMMT